ncbi:enoyl-CoA hydratase-related protein [Mycolicibacterium septicum]|uniref:enoyl-CoA hydratase-related protein n=1 Tax=Mycolicibacterium septicum TaxID=98668 RepID=UPI001AE039B7|nr:enoyl-CoA hydratase-related protein [Mycolicibacterium septicum]
MTASWTDISLDIDDPVATITINRPARHNSLTGRTLRELRGAFDLAERDPRVVGIVLTGAGERAFCAGVDVAMLQGAVADGPGSGGADGDGWYGAFPGDPDMADVQRTFTWPMTIRKPVIGAVNGVCAGGGFILAMACDLRFGSHSARFDTVFSKRGIIAEEGVSWLLPRIIGPSHALDLLWSSRSVAAEEALSIGLMTRLTEPGQLHSECVAYIAELARNASPHSLMVTKRLVYRHLHQDLGSAADEANALNAEALRRPDAVEGAMSLMERRLPRFGRLDLGDSR